MSRRTVVVTALVAVTLSTAAPAVAADPGHPTGTFTVEQHPAPLTGYGSTAGPTTTAIVTVGTLSDDAPADQVGLRLDLRRTPWSASGVRSVVPVGGSGPGGAGTIAWTVSFRYTGTYVPVVTLTDGEGNQTVQVLPAITVTDDATAPVVTLRTPTARHRVAAWRQLRGTATDPDSAVRAVRVELLQRRAGVWYVYDGSRRTWLRGTRNETWTRRHIHADEVRATLSGGSWTTPRIRGLTKGLLVAQANADNVGSQRWGWSPQVRAALTRR